MLQKEVLRGYEPTRDELAKELLEVVAADPPVLRKGTCWFCQTSCEIIRYTHEECMLDYFGKTRRGQGTNIKI